jgi:diacylglycerol kinase (ATP)
MTGTRVFVNPGSAYGRGMDCWRRVEPALRGRLGDFEVEQLEPSALGAALSRAVAAGERRFVSAGGDGAVNLLVNAAMSLPEASDISIGAVGLGSSNDFHKWPGTSGAVAGLPARVDFDKAEAVDVIRVDYEAGSESRVRYAIVNASMGVTAEANARFNEPTRAIRAARRVSVDAAISMSVLTTLIAWRDLTCSLSIDGGEPFMVSVTNLGVFKNPHFGGALRYDFEVGRADGKLGVALCEGLTRVGVVATLSALRKGRFKGLSGTRSWTAERISVGADRRFALETDGEVFRADRASFSVSPTRLRCCG